MKASQSSTSSYALSLAGVYSGGSFSFSSVSLAQNSADSWSNTDAFQGSDSFSLSDSYSDSGMATSTSGSTGSGSHGGGGGSGGGSTNTGSYNASGNDSQSQSDTVSSIETISGSDSSSQSSAGCFTGGSYAFASVVYQATTSFSDSLSESGTGSSSNAGAQSATSSGICTSGNDTSYSYSGSSSFQYSDGQSTSDYATETELGAFANGSYSFNTVSYSAWDSLSASSQDSGNDTQSSGSFSANDSYSDHQSMAASDTMSGLGSFANGSLSWSSFSAAATMASSGSSALTGSTSNTGSAPSSCLYTFSSGGLSTLTIYEAGSEAGGSLSFTSFTSSEQATSSSAYTESGQNAAYSSYSLSDTSGHSYSLEESGSGTVASYTVTVSDSQGHSFSGTLAIGHIAVSTSATVNTSTTQSGTFSLVAGSMLLPDTGQGSSVGLALVGRGGFDVLLPSDPTSALPLVLPGAGAPGVVPMAEAAGPSQAGAAAASGTTPDGAQSSQTGATTDPAGGGGIETLPNPTLDYYPPGMGLVLAAGNGMRMTRDGQTVPAAQDNSLAGGVLNHFLLTEGQQKAKIKEWEAEADAMKAKRTHGYWAGFFFGRMTDPPSKEEIELRAKIAKASDPKNGITRNGQIVALNGTKRPPDRTPRIEDSRSRDQLPGAGAGGQTVGENKKRIRQVPAALGAAALTTLRAVFELGGGEEALFLRFVQILGKAYTISKEGKLLKDGLVVAEDELGRLRDEYKAYKAAAGDAELGQKLDYLFGKAAGNQHNIDRSLDMLRQMERVGLQDTPASRVLMAKHFNEVLKDAASVVETQANGRVVRESLLVGPGGAVKIRSIWDGDKLITFEVLGTGSRFTP